MRKWLLLAAFGLLMQPASATTVTKKIDVPEFTGIVAGSVYDVTLIRSDGCSVEVSYDTRFEDCVRVFVSDGNLVLEFMQPERGRKSRSFDMKDVKLSAVVRMPELTYLRLSGRFETDDRRRVRRRSAFRRRVERGVFRPRAERERRTGRAEAERRFVDRPEGPLRQGFFDAVVRGVQRVGRCAER